SDHDELLERMVTTWTTMIDTTPEVVLLMAEFWLYSLRNPPHGEMVAELLADVRSNLATSTLDAGVVEDADQAERIAGAVQAAASGSAMRRWGVRAGVSPAHLIRQGGGVRGGPPARP